MTATAGKQKCLGRSLALRGYLGSKATLERPGIQGPQGDPGPGRFVHQTGLGVATFELPGSDRTSSEDLIVRIHVPLTSGTWTHPAGSMALLYGWVDFTLPTSCHGPDGRTLNPQWQLRIFMDSQLQFVDQLRDESIWDGRVNIFNAFPLPPTDSAHEVDYPSTKPTMDAIKNIDKAMTEIGEDVILHRGQGNIYDLNGGKIDIASIKPGTAFADHGFMSASVGGEAGLPGNVLLEIQVPANTKGIWADPLSNFPEKEFLLERGLTLVVTEVRLAGTRGRSAKLVAQVVPRARAENLGLAVARNVVNQSGAPAWLMMT